MGKGFAVIVSGVLLAICGFVSDCARNGHGERDGRTAPSSVVDGAMVVTSNVDG